MKGIGGRKADKGEGWLLCSTRCPASALAIRPACACAWAPQSRNTLGLRSSAAASTSRSVSEAQPSRAWLPAAPSSTVSAVLSSSTPCGTRAPANHAPAPPAPGHAPVPCGCCAGWAARARQPALKTPGLRPDRARDRDPVPGSPRGWQTTGSAPAPETPAPGRPRHLQPGARPAPASAPGQPGWPPRPLPRAASRPAPSQPARAPKAG